MRRYVVPTLSICILILVGVGLTELGIYETFVWHKGIRTRHYFIAFACLIYVLSLARFTFVHLRCDKIGRTIGSLPLAVVLFVLFINSCTSIPLSLPVPFNFPSEVKQSDATVVVNMGGFHNRAAYAAEIYHLGLTKKIVVFVPEDERYYGYLVGRLAVPSADVIIADPRTTINTRDEARIVMRLQRLHKWNVIQLVTDPYHLLRTHYAFEKAGVDGFRTSPWPESYLSKHPTRLLGLPYVHMFDEPIAELDLATLMKIRHERAYFYMREGLGLLMYWMLDYI